MTFAKWAKCYGPIYTIKLGFKEWVSTLNILKLLHFWKLLQLFIIWVFSAVFVNDHKLIKELFNETAATGRMADNTVMEEFTGGPYGKFN